MDFTEYETFVNIISSLNYFLRYMFLIPVKEFMISIIPKFNFGAIDLKFRKNVQTEKQIRIVIFVSRYELKIAINLDVADKITLSGRSDHIYTNRYHNYKNDQIVFKVLPFHEDQ